MSNTYDLLRLVASVTLARGPAMFQVPPRTGWAFSGLPIGRGWYWRHNGGILGTTTDLHIMDDAAWCVLANTSASGSAFIDELDEVIEGFMKGKTKWPASDAFLESPSAL